MTWWGQMIKWPFWDLLWHVYQFSSCLFVFKGPRTYIEEIGQYQGRSNEKPKALIELSKKNITLKV